MAPLRVDIGCLSADGNLLVTVSWDSKPIIFLFVDTYGDGGDWVEVGSFADNGSASMTKAWCSADGRLVVFPSHNCVTLGVLGREYEGFVNGTLRIWRAAEDQ